MTENPHLTLQDVIRVIDRTAMDAVPPDERYVQRLYWSPSAEDRTVSLVRTPSGAGSPEGLHTHDYDQMFFLLQGTMAIDVAESRYDAHAGSLIVFPKGVEHRNFNDSDAPTLHLTFGAPTRPRR